MITLMSPRQNDCGMKSFLKRAGQTVLVLNTLPQSISTLKQPLLTIISNNKLVYI